MPTISYRVIPRSGIHTSSVQWYNMIITMSNTEIGLLLQKICLPLNGQFTFLLCFRFIAQKHHSRFSVENFMKLFQIVFELHMSSYSGFYQNALWQKNAFKSCTWVWKLSVESLSRGSVLKCSSSMSNTLCLLVLVFFLLSLSPLDLSPLFPFLAVFVLSTTNSIHVKVPTPLFCVFSWGNFECF